MNMCDLRRRDLLRLVLLSAAATLAACGKVGSPQRPPDADPKSPRFYPADRRHPAGTDELPPDTMPQPYSPPALPVPPDPMSAPTVR